MSPNDRPDMPDPLDLLDLDEPGGARLELDPRAIVALVVIAIVVVVLLRRRGRGGEAAEDVLDAVLEG